MVFVVIPTTKERRARLEKCIASLRENAGMPFTLCIYENEPRGAIIAMHEMLEGITGLVWWIQDDVILTEPNTLKRLYDQYQSGVLCPDDGIVHGEIITLPFCLAHWLKEFTFKGYYHNYADREFTDVMKKYNLYKYCPNIKVDHQHWVNGKAERDETYKLQLNKNDKELYEKRISEGKIGESN
jgi:hypothetical protein